MWLPLAHTQGNETSCMPASPPLGGCLALSRDFSILSALSDLGKSLGMDAVGQAGHIGVVRVRGKK